ncbi:hypothetical protein WJ0W_001715 [Paenibacillus melissococcoides]|uniref:Uncharacterized protein n=1 Tax=Paenibacillus melissococcoides TaxID=2912268 RepID=A0ABM9FYX3_9BACL|nr:hypothetical protein [Paenibacillus melissococcoides]MEB9894728.1 hypothetical protein [Bacillus cereus]CAH8244480.1 hypothetical protein WJ0W_001715 [Paenibacillus melissococcoides]CAH8708112.1 hypothetical protein WDD9_001804 [Paenibacillus melissococcoides]CAH8708818.1 hypothetical protein HTL2_002089 [Paenibacillus melissococcoides]
MPTGVCWRLLVSAGVRFLPYPDLELRAVRAFRQKYCNCAVFSKDPLGEQANPANVQQFSRHNRLNGTYRSELM